jgi:hypothetical protein
MEPITTALLIGSAVKGAVGLAKGIFGASQASKARKEQKSLWDNRPTYERPEEVNEMLDLYRQSAARTQLPGQDLMEEKIGSATAFGARSAERFAPSSTAALGAVTDLYGREQNAVRDLGIQFAQYKAAQEAQLARGLQVGAQYSDQEFQYNKQQPWDIRMNEASSQRQAGAANFWEGLQGVGSAAMDFVGTKYAANAFGGGGFGGAGGGTPVAYQGATPLPYQLNPNMALNNTLTGMRGTPKTY